MKYKRKTYDKFYISHKCCFDGVWRLLSFDFKSEKECDLKLKELNEHVEKSMKDPILHPFGWMDSYMKVKKRIPIK